MNTTLEFEKNKSVHKSITYEKQTKINYNNNETDKKFKVGIKLEKPKLVRSYNV